VVMAAGVADFELDGHLRVESRDFGSFEIGACVENQAVGASGERGGGQKLAGAAVVIGNTAAEFLPMAAGPLDFEHYRNAGSGAALRNVENMGGDVAHVASHQGRTFRLTVSADSFGEQDWLTKGRMFRLAIALTFRVMTRRAFRGEAG
jgi:hypothetical protein